MPQTHLRSLGLKLQFNPTKIPFQQKKTPVPRIFYLVIPFTNNNLLFLREIKILESHL